jgi:WD40 repeat protein/DNA-binding SARP family transcriptional activator
MLRIDTLGGLAITRDGEPVTQLATRKVAALLVYLACTERVYAREVLAELLWEERTPGRALGNLRVALTRLRKHLGDYVLITHDTVAVNPKAEVRLDVRSLEEHLRAGRILAAVAVYHGAFLQGFFVRGAPAFDNWAAQERERLHLAIADALHSQVDRDLAGGAFRDGIAHARRLLALDPLLESAHRQMMLLLAASGQRSAALAQYETCRQVLADELGAEPSPEIRETYELLLKGERPHGIPLAPAARERAPRPVGECPFRGLAAFREEDAPFFFGRESFAERLHRTIQERPLVAVIVGPSGSGKSSTIFAGLLPHLRDAGGWFIADLHPGAEPFRALAGALLPILSPELGETDRLLEARRMADALSRGDLPLADVVVLALQRQPQAQRLLLVADQFEELYTLCLEPEMRRRFLDVLLAAVEVVNTLPEPRFLLLLAIRADFMGRALAHRPFADALQEASVMLGPMNREELGAAVERPAEVQGAAFEAGLVERILDDVGQEPGNLPLLEFALTLLWERQSYGWLTHAGYEQIGRVEGALARYADEVFGALDAGAQAQARQVFVQLVRPGEGTEDTRRVATRAEVAEENWGLVQHLADKRLVVTGRDAAGIETVEVVHEALIQGWGQLRDWMEADRAFRTWQERLRAAVRQWEATGQDEGALLRGAPLAEAEGWLAERGGELSEADWAFIQTGMALRERRAVEREAQLRRELEAARALAAEQALAEERARLAASRELSQDAVNNLSVDPERSILLALQAISLARTTQAEGALHQAVVASRVRLTLTGMAPGVRRVAYSPDGSRLAIAARPESTVFVRDAASGQAILTLPGTIAAYSPDGDRLATATEDGPVTIWAAASGQELLTLTGHTARLNELVFSPDGEYLATASTDETVRVWDGTSGRALLTLPVPSGGWLTGNGVLFNPGGNHLITADFDSVVTVWDLATGDALLALSGAGPMAISPDGKLLLTVEGVNRNILALWDLEASLASGSGQALSQHARHATGITSVAFSPDGTRLATGSLDPTVKVWAISLEGVQESLSLAGHTGAVNGLASSPDGRFLATGSWDGTARIWDISPSGNQEILTLAGHSNRLSRVAYSPDGARLATTNEDGRAAILDAKTGETLFTFRHPRGAVWEVTFSPDGTRLATAGQDNTARVWDAKDGQDLLTLTGHAQAPPVGGWYEGLTTVAFSPDGKLLASAGADGQAILWDMETGERVLALQVHPDGIGVTRVAFSPGGTRLAAASDAHPVEGDPEGGRPLVSVWNLASGQEQYAVTDLPNRAWALAFSPDGTKLVVGVEADFLKVCDATSGEESLSLGGHSGDVYAAAFSPDGALLATAGHEPPKLWDLSTGQKLVTFPGHTDTVDDLAFSPDGTRLASSSSDGTIRVYAVDVDELVALAQSRLTRWFTPAECRQYLHMDVCPTEP